MIVYQADKTQFVRDTEDKEIDELIHDIYRAKTGKSVGIAELRSWRESLGHMARVLRDHRIPEDTGVAVEFHIPQSTKRIDVTLTGYGDGGQKNVVVIELKQWEKAAVSEKDALVMTFLGRTQREVVHPSYQAWSYATLLEGFNSAVYEGAIAVRPCAYLHNYPRDGAIDSAHYADYIHKAPLFLKGEKRRSNCANSSGSMSSTVTSRRSSLSWRTERSAHPRLSPTAWPS